MEFTFTFLKTFTYGLYYTAPLLAMIVLTTICLGLIVGRVESLTKFDALYWSFITATTVGYGDIRPLCRTSKVISILIALTGLIFTGIIVAIAVRAATYAFNTHVDLVQMKTLFQQ